MNVFCFMQYMLKIRLASLLAVLMTFQAFGETPADSVKVYFRVGHRLFDPAFSNNGLVMDNFIKKVQEAKAEDNIDYLTVSGFASPEGASDANERLARLRCNEIAQYIEKHAEIPSSLIETHPEGVAWGELRNIVAERTDVPYREKILQILDNTPLWIFNSQGKIIGGRKKQLMELDGGSAWNWMYANIFPELRNAVAVVLYLKREEISHQEVLDPTDLPGDPDISHKADTCSQADSTDDISHISDMSDYADMSSISDFSTSMQLQAARKPFYMAIKTNMLFDAALVPNLGAEFYLGKNISIYGEWMYAWWENNSRHRYWQTYGGDLGLRWWFGRKAHSKPLTGHHLGLYGGILIFDFENGDTGYMGGKPGGTLWDRFLINSGIEYGYSFPVAKRLNIDLSIGFGYLGGNYIKYYPFDNDYYREKEYKLRYFGPAKAEISLVWLIGRGNTNHRKGGDR